MNLDEISKEDLIKENNELKSDVSKLKIEIEQLNNKVSMIMGMIK